MGGDKKMISTEVVLAMAHSNHILGYGSDVDQEPEARQHQDRAPEVGCERSYDTQTLIFNIRRRRKKAGIVVIELEEHLKTHKDIETFPCDLCGKQFFLKWRLKKHIVGHDGKRFCHFL